LDKYVLIGIQVYEPEREILAETWKELLKKRRNLYFARYIVTAVKSKVIYMDGTYSTMGEVNSSYRTSILNYFSEGTTLGDIEFERSIILKEIFNKQSCKRWG
jgi:hypothetical protein